MRVSVPGPASAPQAAHLRSLPLDERRPALEICRAPRGSRGARRCTPRFHEDAVLPAAHRRRSASERHAAPRCWRIAGPVAVCADRPLAASKRGRGAVRQRPPEHARSRVKQGVRADRTSSPRWARRPAAQMANRRCAATRRSRLAFSLARASGPRRRGCLWSKRSNEQPEPRP